MMEPSKKLLPIIRVAAGYVGGVSKLGVILGIKHQGFYLWRQVPAHHVLKIEAATGGKVSRHDLRLDLYPRESAA